MELELCDLLEIKDNKVQRHAGSPENVLLEIKEKCDRLFTEPRKYDLNQWAKMIRENVMLPEYWQAAISCLRATVDRAEALKSTVFR